MRSTKIQFMEFIDSNVWTDIRNILLIRLNDCRDSLETGINSGIEEIRIEQGRAEELRYILDLPRSIVEDWESLNEDMKEE